MLLTHAPETSRAVYDRLVARLSHVRSVRFERAGEETGDPWRVRLDRHKRRVDLGSLHEVPLG